jgi:hypothetical protein
MLKVFLSGFPHSDISGSKSICDSPKHFGAYPVLLRLLVPRHPPYALNILTYLFIYFLLLCSFQGSFFVVRVYVSSFSTLNLALQSLRY